jgi:hypothetical protein
LLENKTPNERHSQNKKCETSDYDHTDDAIDHACLSSDLHKPAQTTTTTTTKTNKHGQSQKKAKHSFKPDLVCENATFDRQKEKTACETRLVKALVNTGASASITTLESAKDPPLVRFRFAKSGITIH